jgi:hypothetical protein
MGRIVSTVGIKRFDRDMNLLESRNQPMRSWTKHFFDLWYEWLGRATNEITVNDISGAARLVKKAYAAAAGIGNLCNLQVGAPAGGTQALIGTQVGVATAEMTYGYATPFMGEHLGIVIGTDNTAVTPADDALGVKINHGKAAGQMEYGGCEVLEPTFADPNGSMIVRRFFTNRSGGGITVEEVGIYSPGWNAVRTAYAFCIARDVTGGVVVADTEILLVTYTVGITV